MAGNPLNFEATSCPNCGVKLSAVRRRCPRCHARLTQADPALAAAASRRLARIAAMILGGFLVVLVGLWVVRDPDPAPAVAAPIDPFASRRPVVTPAPAGSPDAQPDEERPFLDPQGEAAVAYEAGKMDSALQHYQQAVDRNPNDAESHSNLGQVLVRLKRPAEALPHFDRAIELIPDRWAYVFNRARALGLVGRWEESVAAYRRAQALFPDDYVTAFNLALALRKLGKHEAALPEFQKAIALEPNDATFRIALGMTFERLQKPTEAAAAYEEALRLAPEAPDADTVRKRIVELRGSSGT